MRFDFEHVTPAFSTEACNACHQAAAADDFVFTQYYPVLRAGKGTGKNAVGGTMNLLTPTGGGK